MHGVQALQSNTDALGKRLQERPASIATSNFTPASTLAWTPPNADHHVEAHTCSPRGKSRMPRKLTSNAKSTWKKGFVLQSDKILLTRMGTTRLLLPNCALANGAEEELKLNRNFPKMLGKTFLKWHSTSRRRLRKWPRNKLRPTAPNRRIEAPKHGRERETTERQTLILSLRVTNAGPRRQSLITGPDAPKSDVVFLDSNERASSTWMRNPDAPPDWLSDWRPRRQTNQRGKTKPFSDVYFGHHNYQAASSSLFGPIPSCDCITGPLGCPTLISTFYTNLHNHLKCFIP